jgi:hypothetical protein
MGKLHDQMKEDLLLKAYSPHTIRNYLRCGRHFAPHSMRSPEEMGEQEVRDFLLHLVRDRQASPATFSPSSFEACQAQALHEALHQGGEFGKTTDEKRAGGGKIRAEVKQLRQGLDPFFFSPQPA